jgi:hypothetical protein
MPLSPQVFEQFVYGIHKTLQDTGHCLAWLQFSVRSTLGQDDPPKAPGSSTWRELIRTPRPHFMKIVPPGFEQSDQSSQADTSQLRGHFMRQ